MDVQSGMGGNITGEVVVEIAYRGALLQQPQQGLPILIQGNVQHRHTVALPRLHPPEQGDVALHPGDQGGIRGLRQAQLL